MQIATPFNALQLWVQVSLTSYACTQIATAKMHKTIRCLHGFYVQDFKLHLAVYLTESVCYSPKRELRILVSIQGR